MINGQWRVGAIGVGALALGEIVGAALSPVATLGSALAILLAGVGGAFGAAAIFDALCPLLPAALRVASRDQQASGQAAADTGASSAWNFEYCDPETDDAWSSDSARSQVAWAEATLAARDAWERAARTSRARVVSGKRVALGDPPPRSGDDT